MHSWPQDDDAAVMTERVPVLETERAVLEYLALWADAKSSQIGAHLAKALGIGQSYHPSTPAVLVRLADRGWVRKPSRFRDWAISEKGRRVLG